MLDKRKDSSVWFKPLVATCPLPTILQDVLGKRRRRRVKQKPDRMARNQKMLCQPRYCVIALPSTAPRTNARFGL